MNESSNESELNKCEKITSYLKPVDHSIDMPGTSKMVILQNEVIRPNTYGPNIVNANTHLLNERKEDIDFRAEHLMEISKIEFEENLPLVENEISQEISNEINNNIISRKPTTKTNFEFNLTSCPTKKSKWSTLKYFRSARIRRAREKIHQGQYFITIFFDIADNLCKIIMNNPEVADKIIQMFLGVIPAIILKQILQASTMRNRKMFFYPAF